jgi:hypothetical protein
MLGMPNRVGPLVIRVDEAALEDLRDRLRRTRWPEREPVGDWSQGVPAQAVFIGGNALRAIGVIAALEEDLRRPVLTANQVSLWYALRVAGAGVGVDDYGQLFKQCR